MSKKKFDWDYYRERYIFGGDEVTLEQMTQYPNAPKLQTLKGRAAKEKWADQRKAYRYKTHTKTTDAISSTEAEITARHVRISHDMQEKALERLKAIVISDLTPNDLRLFIKDATELERKALGLDEPFAKRKVIAREAFAQLFEELKSDMDVEFNAKLQIYISRAMERATSSSGDTARESN